MLGGSQIRERKKEMEEKYLTVVEEHVDRLGEMAKNIQEVGVLVLYHDSISSTGLILIRYSKLYQYLTTNTDGPQRLLLVVNSLPLPPTAALLSWCP